MSPTVHEQLQRESPSGIRTRGVPKCITAVLICALLALSCGPVWAQEDADDVDETDETETEAETETEEDASPTRPRLPDPVYVLEAIELSGDYSTRDDIVLEALGLELGQEVNVEIMREAKLRLLATGYFETAQFGLARGTERGHVVLEVKLDERNTVMLSDVYLGTSQRSDFWGGLDAVDGNMFGIGHTARAAFVTSGKQTAFEVGYEDPSIGGSIVSAAVAGHFSQGRELAWPIVVVPGLGTDPLSMEVSRGGGRLSLGVRPLTLLGIFLDLRLEAIDARTDLQPLLEPLIEEGSSALASARLSVDLDTRDDPVMPSRGLRLNVSAEGSSADAIGDYSFVKLLGQFNFAWEFVPGHILRFDSAGGGIFGDAPYFDRFFVGDFNDLVPARNLGLNFSSRPAIDFFNTGADQLGYELFIVRGSVEYAIPILNRLDISWIYRTEFFVSGGVWAATTPEDDRTDVVTGLEPNPGVRDAFPFDLTVDLGLRVETTIGIFGLSFANGLALIPF